MMINSKNLLIFLVVIFNIFVIIPYVSDQGFRGFYNPKIEEMKLLSRDVNLYKNDSICFKYSSNSSVKVFLNENFILETTEKEICINSTKYGKNKIDIIDENNRSLRFYANILDDSCNIKDSIELKVNLSSKITQHKPLEIDIYVTYKGCKTKYDILRIYLDGKIKEEIQIKLTPNENKKIVKRVVMDKAGIRKLQIEINNNIWESLIEVHPTILISFINSFLILILFLYMFRVFGFHTFKYFSSIFLCFLVLLPLIFDLLGFSIFNMMQIFFFALVLFSLFIVRKNKIKKKYRLKNVFTKNIKLKNITLISIASLLILVNIPKVLFPTQHTNWNTFYERQVRETFYNEKLPKFDNLSYFGRYMSFTPGYFGAKASFLYLFGLGYNNFSDFIFEFFINLTFLISLLFLLKEIGIKNYQRALFILLFTSSLFLFTLLAAHLMHTLSITLTFLSLSFSLKLLDSRRNYLSVISSKNLYISGILLGAATLVHPFSILMFAIFILSIKIDSIKNFNEFKRLFLIGLLIIGFSTLIFLLFFIRTLIELGPPYEALGKEWGWFRHWNFFAIFGEFFFITPIILFSIFIGILNKNTRRLAILILILIIIYSEISFRVNICIAFLSSLLIARFLKDKEIIYLFIIISIFNSIFLIYRLGNYVNPCIDSGYLSNECLLVINFLRFLDGDKVINDPILSHPITFIAEKKVLADLFVEYADEKKLIDALDFARSGNLEIAKKWNVDLVLTKFDCNNFTKVYDNRYYKICEIELS